MSVRRSERPSERLATRGLPSSIVKGRGTQWEGLRHE
jgi:hypothetical protein